MKTLRHFAFVAWLTCVAAVQAAGLAAPHVVEITRKLTTSGQPDAEALTTLRAQGFDVVIQLTPPTRRMDARTEGTTLRKQHVDWVHIPMQSDVPTERELHTLSALLGGFNAQRVLVHCQANRHTSALIFLHRAIVLKEDPATAYQAVAEVWRPEGPTRQFIEDQLRKNDVQFALP